MNWHVPAKGTFLSLAALILIPPAMLRAQTPMQNFKPLAASSSDFSADLQFAFRRRDLCWAFLLSVFPAGSDTRWETECRIVWNEREHTTEERELVYEISWIAQLGA